MSTEPISGFVPVFPINPTVSRVLAHLCEGDCRAFGDLMEWCETRGDCSVAVVCPTCKSQFLIDEDDLAELRRWTETHGNAFVCGINLTDD